MKERACLTTVFKNNFLFSKTKKTEKTRLTTGKLFSVFCS